MSADAQTHTLCFWLARHHLIGTILADSEVEVLGKACGLTDDSMLHACLLSCRHWERGCCCRLWGSFTIVIAGRRMSRDGCSFAFSSHFLRNFFGFSSYLSSHFLRVPRKTRITLWRTEYSGSWVGSTSVHTPCDALSIRPASCRLRCRCRPATAGPTR